MTKARTPEMSVVLVAPDGFESVRETISHLKAQSARDRLELVFVAPSAAALALDPAEVRVFHSHRVVEAGGVDSTGAARAAGVRVARAEVVAFAEEHCYPEPGWARALVARHAEGWAAVAPAVSNANPKTATSRANFLLSFAPWAEGAAAAEVERLPWHNTSYKRALLVGYGDALGGMLEAEGIVQADLRRKGQRLFFEPAAVTRHLNISRLSSYLGEQFHAGRRFAAALTSFERAPLPRRLARACAAPLAVPLRLSNVWREARRSGRRRDQRARALAPLLAGLCAHAAGEALGHALGAGDSYRRSSEFEFRHAERLSKADELPGGLPPKSPRTAAGSRAANEPAMNSVSVIVETYNARHVGAAGLASVLESLRAQTYPRELTEIIVVFDEACGGVVESSGGGRDGVRFVAMKDANYFPMKNYGLRFARGDVIAFLDSDCVPCERWIERAAANVARGADAAAGQTSYPAGKLWSRTFDFFDFGYARADARGEASCFYANNVAFRREVILAHGFDARLGRGGGCHLLSRQLKRRGYRVVYDAAQAVTHAAAVNSRFGFALERLRAGHDAINLCRLDEEGVLPEKKFARLGALAPAAVCAARVASDFRRAVVNREELGVSLRAVPYFCAASLFLRSIEMVGGIVTWARPDYFREEFGW